MKERIIDDLKACKIAFSQAGIPFIIIGGTVLGYARYNDIMEWDTD
jgi:predicted nucleotidyltransferase